MAAAGWSRCESRSVYTSIVPYRPRTAMKATTTIVRTRCGRPAHGSGRGGRGSRRIPAHVVLGAAIALHDRGLHRGLGGLRRRERVPPAGRTDERLGVQLRLAVRAEVPVQGCVSRIDDRPDDVAVHIRGRHAQPSAPTGPYAIPRRSPRRAEGCGPVECPRGAMTHRPGPGASAGRGGLWTDLGTVRAIGCDRRSDRVPIGPRE